MRVRNFRCSWVGIDGYVALLLSNVLILLTAGVSFYSQLLRVVRTARHARTDAPAGLTVAVLGKRLLGGRIDKDYIQRLERAYELYARNGNRDLWIIGGSSGDDAPSEAAVGREYLVTRGVSPSKLAIEDKSLHTLQNLRSVRNLVNAAGRDSVILVTNRYHLARAEAIANGLGMSPVLCAAEGQFVVRVAALPRLLLEAYYLHWYRVGSVWVRLTNNKKGLARIQ